MKNLRVIWLVLAILILVVTVVKYDGTPNSDIEEFLVWTTSAIGFPSSLLGGVVIVATAYVGQKMLAHSVTTSDPWLVFEWLMLVATGYLQWFYLVPKLWRRLRHRESALKETSSGRVAHP